MKKKKVQAIILIIVFAILSNLYIFTSLKQKVERQPTTIKFSVSSDKNIGLQIFYSETTDMTPEKVFDYSYENSPDKLEISAEVPYQTNYIRIDIGEEDSVTTLSDFSLSSDKTTYVVTGEMLNKPITSNGIENVEVRDTSAVFTCVSNDPYTLLSIEEFNNQVINEANNAPTFSIYKIIICLVIDIVCLIIILNFDKIIAVPLNIYRNRGLMWALAKNDFQARFAGSYLGIFWAFVQPVITILLYWFVFEVGLRSGKVSDYPFILFLMSGLIPWFYFSEALNGGTNSLTEYSYLVKKVVFDVDILPLIKIISSMFVHLFFIVFILVICSFYGYWPDFFTFQLAYYIVCSCMLVVGLSYIFSACTAFFKDTTQIVNILLTIGVWITPIMWNPIGNVSSKLYNIFRLNPVYYIVDGFRDCLLNKVWFWEKPVWTIYFWIITLLIYYVGIKVFHKLKPHFSDVL